MISKNTERPLSLHNWDVQPSKAAEIQNHLRKRAILYDDFKPIETVAGVDVGFDIKSNYGKAAIVVLHASSLEIVESAVAESQLCFPYVPGLLSFREIPVILQALSRLNRIPDLLLCDGQGIAHPRRFGIACHLGVLTDLPAIGVAKTKLIGDHDKVPEKKGKWTKLDDNGETIGAVLRTRERVKPLYISPGHKISLESSVSWVMKCVTRYRLPETTRYAHNFSLFARKDPAER